MRGLFEAWIIDRNLLTSEHILAFTADDADHAKRAVKDNRNVGAGFDIVVHRTGDIQPVPVTGTGGPDAERATWCCDSICR